MSKNSRKTVTTGEVVKYKRTMTERGGFFKEMNVPKAALIVVGSLVVLGFSIALINETIALTQA